jgi:CRP/FNR family transcriptional regulator
MPRAQHDAHRSDWDGWAAVEPAPLFTGLSPEDFKRISATARLKRFERGEILYLEGDTVQQVLLLVSGSIRITERGLKGLEVILRLGGSGDVFDV